LTRQILSGNQAAALGALRAGVHLVTGYPGTPSTGCVAHLLSLDLSDRHVEWSANEKVAFEIASGAAWAGHRALCTMKMSGVNVAFDAIISIAYSGTNGGLVIYVADDPGVSAGMPEQDSRGFAQMAYLPIIEPASAQETYDLVQAAFSLSEKTGAPVFVRSTTAVALGYAPVEVEAPHPPRKQEPLLERDIARYTKAGARICLDQHQAALDRLRHAEAILREMSLNTLSLTASRGGLGVLSVGAASAYLPEALSTVGDPDISVLACKTTFPFPVQQAESLLDHCERVLVLEELEPYAERELRVLAQQTGFRGQIVGKLRGPLSSLGEYGLNEILEGLRACGLSGRSAASPSSRSLIDNDEDQPSAGPTPQTDSLSRPITVCAGCPHRGTYLAVEAALRELGLSKDQVMITGDIGCTILGMNPPFDLLWNEVSMGSSISLAQGYVHAGVPTPVIAMIGDSTLLHGGIPGLINAVQHRVPLTLIVMDNGWTSMTGMQVNAGTDQAFQPHGRQVNLEAVLRGLGPDRLEVVDPLDLPATTRSIATGLRDPGVNVILAQRECAIQAQRRGIVIGRTLLDPEKCVLCKRCLRTTGCPALGIQHDGPGGKPTISLDPRLCTGCGLCAQFCPTGALTHAAGGATNEPRRKEPS
jgi:indolepyruvate ferredoxin oxidoreductase, alpha subunit